MTFKARNSAVKAILAIVAGCAASPVLPDDPSYTAGAAGETARISVSEDLRTRVDAILELMDRRIMEMKALHAQGGPALESLQRSYVKMVRSGLLVTLEQALESGEDVARIAMEALPRLENQRMSLQNLAGSLTLPNAEGPLAACKGAIEFVREMAEKGSFLPKDRIGGRDLKTGGEFGAL